LNKAVKTANQSKKADKTTSQSNNTVKTVNQSKKKPKINLKHRENMQPLKKPVPAKPANITATLLPHQTGR